jgi:hypothetical protein
VKRNLCHQPQHQIALVDEFKGLNPSISGLGLGIPNTMIYQPTVEGRLTESMVTWRLADYIIIVRGLVECPFYQPTINRWEKRWLLVARADHDRSSVV